MSKGSSLDPIFQLVHGLKRCMQREIEKLDLTITPMHVRVLKIVGYHQNCTSVDIANLLDRDKAQVTRLIKTLLDDGFIEKLPNPHDKRSQCLSLTEQGNEITRKISDLDKKVFAEMTAGLSEQELEQFKSTAASMVKNLSL